MPRTAPDRISVLRLQRAVADAVKSGESLRGLARRAKVSEGLLRKICRATPHAAHSMQAARRRRLEKVLELPDGALTRSEKEHQAARERDLYEEFGVDEAAPEWAAHTAGVSFQAKRRFARRLPPEMSASDRLDLAERVYSLGFWRLMFLPAGHRIAPDDMFGFTEEGRKEHDKFARYIASAVRLALPSDGPIDLGTAYLLLELLSPETRRGEPVRAPNIQSAAARVKRLLAQRPGEK